MKYINSMQNNEEISKMYNKEIRKSKQATTIQYQWVVYIQKRRYNYFCYLHAQSNLQT